ncbi:MAG: hypothetical protein WCS77_09555 [Elusimicrobiaceae bacterium]
MKKFFAIAVLVLAGAAQSVFAAPAQVVILRHAEKPEVGNELNKQGWRRAYALVGFFRFNKHMNKFGAPAAIYAMAPKDAQGTLRPIQTITPTAKELGLPIRTNYKKKEEAALVKEIMSAKAYDGRTVLVCWEHHAIEKMVEEFGWKGKLRAWPDEVYDRAWVLTFDGRHVKDLKDMPQRVLPGDSNK